MAVYSQWTTLGLKPQVFPKATLHCQYIFVAFLTLSEMCCFQLSFLSSITPKNLTWLSKESCTPFSLGSLKFLAFLALVKSTSFVFCGLTERPCSVHHFSTIESAEFISELKVLSNLPMIRMTRSSAKPSVLNPARFSSLKRLTITIFQRIGERTPP